MDMKRVHLFMSVLVFSFIVSMNIMTADKETEASPTREHGVTPISPRKPKDSLTVPQMQVQHPVTPIREEIQGASASDHGTTPVKVAQVDGQENDGLLARSESFDRLAQSVRGLPSAARGFPSCASLNDMHVALAVTHSPASPKNIRAALTHLAVNGFPASCDHGVTPIR
jgi:hypothetical protein